jgi:hypothetical protein
MKLMYRGVEYDHNPVAVESTLSPLQGCYRGAKYQIPLLSQNSIVPTAKILQYRGVTYSTNPALKPVPQAAPAAQPTAGRSRATQPATASLAASLRLQLPAESAQAHKASILKNIERRIEVARSKGDNALLSALEAEWRQYA